MSSYTQHIWCPLFFSLQLSQSLYICLLHCQLCSQWQQLCPLMFIFASFLISLMLLSRTEQKPRNTSEAFDVTAYTDVHNKIAHPSVPFRNQITRMSNQSLFKNQILGKWHLPTVTKLHHLLPGPAPREPQPLALGTRWLSTGWRDPTPMTHLSCAQYRDGFSNWFLLTTTVSLSHEPSGFTKASRRSK